MLRHKGYAFKLTVFTLLAACCLSAVNKVLIPKYFYNADWATTSTFMDFYDMDRDSIDVLFLGSSHCVAAFSPVELYERYGIRSYNLGSEQQNLLLSYYWLQEALRFQKPQYVFLDTFMLFPYDAQSPLNTSEATMRKAVDFMRWSGVKAEAVHDICAIDTSQRQSSYFFPNVRFHTRWKALGEDDFSVASMGGHESLMGFYPLSFECHTEGFQPFCPNGQTECAQMVPVMREYLDKIVRLCEDRGIELVLTKSPTMFYSQENYRAVCEYAGENGLEYIDFNEESVYQGAGLDFAVDSCDTDHASVSGAMKISDYIGEWLLDKVSHGWEDEQWERRAQFYHHYMKDRELVSEKELCQYLRMLQDEKYSVWITVMGDASAVFGSEAAEELRGLGLTPELAEEYGQSYSAVIDSGKVLWEAAGGEALDHRGTVREGLVRYSVQSAGESCGNSCSVLINGGELALRQPGLNLVVYCNDSKRVIDRVCFRMEQGQITCSHTG